MKKGMKKKIIALALVAALGASAAIGGTLAYFNDTESDVNEFTLGNVVIDLVEEQRNDNGSALEEFEDGKVLLPIVGSAQDKSNQSVVGGYTLPDAANWVDKIVTVDNEGTQDAYVRVLMAFPEKMDAPIASDMMMHWNHDGTEAAGNWNRADCGVKVTLGGEVYNVYNFTYNPILTAKGEEGSTTASPAMTGVYIDSRVNATVDANGAITYSMVDSTGKTVSATYAKDTAPKLYVLTQGVQEAGFATADEALTAGFGKVTQENAQKWFDAVVADDGDGDGNREDIA